MKTIPIPEVTVKTEIEDPAYLEQDDQFTKFKTEKNTTELFENCAGILRECLVCNKTVTNKDACCADDFFKEVLNSPVEDVGLLPPVDTTQKIKKRRGRKNIHGHAPFQCLFCSKLCRLKQQLDTHILTHIGEKPNDCHYCDWSFSDYAALRRHELALHKGGLPTRYGCSYCDKKFYHAGHLEIHERSHTGEKPFKCDLCFRTYTQKPHLDLHVRSFHTGEKPHSCVTCHKKFASIGRLNLHRKSHSQEKTLGCQECGARYKHRAALVRHIRAVHTGEKPYTCKLCGRAFCDGSDLSRHVRRHEGDKRYVCVFCGRAFVQSGVLWIHIRVHIKEKPFECLECGKTFSSSTDNTKHAKSHSRTLDYSCIFCGKCLKQKRSMDRHMLGHIGEKPWDCVVCSEAFQTAERRRNHMRIVHSM